MTRLLPSPGLSVALFLLWVLLMQAVDPGTLLLGAAMAVFWPLATRSLRPGGGRMKRPGVLARLVVRVVGVMLRSNLEVAWAIIARRPRNVPSGFVHVPLELQHPSGLAALAMIVTFTPGTAWAQLSADRRTLLLHVLAVKDEAELVTLIKRGFERPLMEIFE